MSAPQCVLSTLRLISTTGNFLVTYPASELISRIFIAIFLKYIQNFICKNLHFLIYFVAPSLKALIYYVGL